MTDSTLSSCWWCDDARMPQFLKYSDRMVKSLPGQDASTWARASNPRSEPRSTVVTLAITLYLVHSALFASFYFCTPHVWDGSNVSSRRRRDSRRSRVAHYRRHSTNPGTPLCKILIPQRSCRCGFPALVAGLMHARLGDESRSTLRDNNNIRHQVLSEDLLNCKVVCSTSASTATVPHPSIALLSEAQIFAVCGRQHGILLIQNLRPARLHRAIPNVC